jgi:hypothetical protein
MTEENRDLDGSSKQTEFKDDLASKKGSGNRPTPGPLKSEDSTGINFEKAGPIDPKMPHLPPA